MDWTVPVDALPTGNASPSFPSRTPTWSCAIGDPPLGTLEAADLRVLVEGCETVITRTDVWKTGLDPREQAQ